MRTSLICLFALVASGAVAQHYDASLIPDSLKENANAVKRFEVLEVSIKSPSKAVVKHKWAITILNEEGARYASYQNSYDKLQSLEDISGKLFDASGKHLRSIRKKEIADVSSDDNMSLMTDNRIKYFDFHYKQYPYTVEFEDEQVYSGVFFLPAWFPVEAEGFSVQHSQLIVRGEDNYAVRYKAFPSHLTPVVSTDKKDNVLTWSVSNRPAYLYEPFQPSPEELLPHVKLAPSEFELQGYKGNMNSWLEFGKFRQALYAGRDVLPDFIKDSVKTITGGLNSEVEKIEALYRFMQRNTRYISIQLGIGGWQPFDANFVATKKYGDCKALSNYMMALLKEAGIKGNMVAIYSGRGHKGLDESFPSNQFNHIVLNVPLKNDTMWLECTSQTLSPGYMGSSTGNRKALMIGDDGGHVVSTPRYRAADNLQLRKIVASVDASGNLVAESYTHFTGEQQETPHAIIHSLTEGQKKEYLNEELSIPTYNVESIRYNETTGRKPSVDEYIKINAPNYATITGKRLFIVPNLFNKSGLKLNQDNERKFPIEFRSAYRDVDSIEISIPDGYVAESMPKDVSINSKFGKYAISYRLNKNKLEVVRLTEHEKGVFPAADYPQLVKFFEDIYKADRAKLVLVKPE